MLEAQNLMVFFENALAINDLSLKVHDGELVGVIRKAALQGVDRGLRVGDLMDDPVFLDVGDGYEETEHLADQLEGAPIPVVDGEGRLVGCVKPKPTEHS